MGLFKHEEELERLRIEEEERKKKEAEERRLLGLDEEDDKKKKKTKKDDSAKDGDAAEDDETDETEKKAEGEEEDENEPKKKVEEWKPYIPEIPNKINWAHYSSPDTFWLSMDDYDAGYLYEYKFLTEAEKSKLPSDKVDDPIAHVPVHKSDLVFGEDIPLNCLTFRLVRISMLIVN